MKGLQVFVALMGVFIQLPISIFGSYLLYKHVQATEMMWFLWWLTIPLMVISQIITQVVIKVLGEDK